MLCSASLQPLSFSRFLLTAVPLDRAPQALFETHFRLVCEMVFDTGQIRQRMFDVPSALGFVLHVASVADDFFQQLESLVQINSCAGCDIEHLARSLRCWSFCGQQVGLDRVVNISEIAALAAIAKNRWLFAIE